MSPAQQHIATTCDPPEKPSVQKKKLLLPAILTQPAKESHHHPSPNGLATDDAPISDNTQRPPIQWVLLASVVLLFLYGMVFWIGSIVAYTNGFENASVIAIANKGTLALTFTASLACVSTSMIGFAGCRCKQQQQRRVLLSLYHVLLWLCLSLIAAVGYTTTQTDSSLDTQWRQELGYQDQLVLQTTLGCCGFAHPMDHAAYKGTCQPESLVQGCSYKLEMFQQTFRARARVASLTLIPFHIIVIVIASLYSHHVEQLFSACKSSRWNSSPFPKEGKHPHDSQPFYGIQTKLDDCCPACANWSLAPTPGRG